MPVGKMTSKGQTTIPKDIRVHLKLKPGDQVTYMVDGDQVIMRAKNRSLMDLAGFLKRPGQKPLSVEEMDEAIGEAVSKHVLGE